ncbi:MAG: helix-turn-helix domain-containing protein [Candidatus Nanopelagicales bacterium]
MPRRRISMSRPAADALEVLGQQVRLRRTALGWTIADTAARLGIDESTVSKIERGYPSPSVGTVFNVAVLVGVDLYGLDGADLARARRAGEDTLALLPAKVRTPVESDDGLDF